MGRARGSQKRGPGNLRGKLIHICPKARGGNPGLVGERWGEKNTETDRSKSKRGSGVSSASRKENEKTRPDCAANPGRVEESNRGAVAGRRKGRSKNFEVRGGKSGFEKKN